MSFPLHDTKVHSLVNYYIRERLLNSAVDVCSELLKRSPSDEFLQFWKALTGYLSGNVGQVMPVLRSLQGHKVLGLSCTAVILAAAMHGKVVDSEYDLTERLDNDLLSAGGPAQFTLAATYGHLGMPEKALLTLDNLEMADDTMDSDAQALRGWLLLSQASAEESDDEDTDLRDDLELTEAAELFDRVLSDSPSHIEGLMGRARAAELLGDPAAALSMINQVHVKHAWFPPALVEKARLSLELHGWPEVMDCVQKLQQLEGNNVMAFAYRVLHSMLVNGDNEAAARHLKDLVQAVNRGHANNGRLMNQISAPIARVACGDVAILSHTQLLARKALELSSDSKRDAAELARQLMLSGDFAGALALLHREGSSSASNLVGLMTAECEALTGEIESAQGTLQLYASTLDSPDESAYGAYVNAILAIMSKPSADAAIAEVEAAVQGLSRSLEFYRKLDPSRLIVLVRLMLERVAAEASTSSAAAAAPCIGRCIAILEALARHAPKLHGLSVLHARALFVNGSHDAALQRLSEIIHQRPSEVEAHLMQASIFLAQGRAPAAGRSVQAALAGNFSARSWPLYHVLDGRIRLERALAERNERRRKDLLEEARQGLAAAYAMPGVKSGSTAEDRLVGSVRLPSPHERASILCMYAAVLHHLSDGHSKESQEIVAGAERLFEGTSEEVTVLTAACELAISKQDVGQALKKLRRIPQTSPVYRAARRALAGLYLRLRKDARSYSAAYLDLVNIYRDYDSYVQAGDAFLNIQDGGQVSKLGVQEPDKAIEMFNSALQLGNANADILARIARAHLRKHAYRDAITFFAKAVKRSPENVALRQEKAALFVQMRELDMAEAELQQCDRSLESRDEDSVEVATLRVRTAELRATAASIAEGPDAHLERLEAALAAQKSLLALMRCEHEDLVEEQKQRACSFAAALASLYARHRKFDEAKAAYRDVLGIKANHASIMLQLAQLEMQTGKLDECKEQCNNVLRVKDDVSDADHQGALLMLAQVLFAQEQSEAALLHFSNLLEAEPGHTEARSSLLLCLRRAGKQDDIPQHMAEAERHASDTGFDAGYLYCRALHHKFKHEPQQVLRDANAARMHPALASSATYLMIETYLQPLIDALWAGESSDPGNVDRAVSNCQQLLTAMPASDRATTRWQVMWGCTLLVGQDTKQVESAIAALLGIAQQDISNVPVLLAIATGFVRLGQIPKARNQLKRIQKTPYNFKDGDEFEQAWLLLANIHIGAGKYDLAEDCCSLCLKYNKSCARAWELKGMILEKEASYQSAAEAYQHAWHLTNQSNPAVGFRLAWNFVKAIRYVDAINVANVVLSHYPDYPKIREQVLDKAMSRLRADSEREERKRVGLDLPSGAPVPVSS